MKNLLVTLTLLLVYTLCIHATTIVIDVPGSIYAPGRQIGDCFERGILLSLTDQIKKKISQEQPNITIILNTQITDSELSPQQRAHRYNTIQADFLLVLAAYQEETDPHAYLYQFKHDNIPPSYSNTCALYPFSQAYLKAYPNSCEYAQLCNSLFNNKPYNQQLITHEPSALPITPLSGITIPAILIEIGIISNTQAELFIEPITKYIQSLHDHMNLKRKHAHE